MAAPWWEREVDDEERRPWWERGREVAWTAETFEEGLVTRGEGGKFGGGGAIADEKAREEANYQAALAPYRTLPPEIAHALHDDRDGPENRPPDAGQVIEHPKDAADFDRFMAQVEQTPEWREVEARTAALAGDTPKDELRFWSKENNTDENGNYTPERQALHDAIKAKMLPESAIAPEGVKPQLVLLIGPAAAGKTSAGAPIAEKLAPSFAHITADYVKENLPEYRGWNSVTLHEESTDVAEKDALPYAMEHRYNTLFDATGANTEKMTDLARTFGEKGYDVHVIDVRLPSHEAAGRAWDRFNDNSFNWNGKGATGDKYGRFLPPSVSFHMGDKAEHTYESLKAMPEVKSWVAISTDVPFGSPRPVVDSGRRDQTNAASRFERGVRGARQRSGREGFGGSVGGEALEGGDGEAQGGALAADAGGLAAEGCGPWWERWVAWTAETFDESLVTRGEGGKFGGGGGGTPEPHSEREAKADTSWARAQDKKPGEAERRNIKQEALPGIGLPTLKELQTDPAAAKQQYEQSRERDPRDWSDPARLDRWESYDKAVEEGVRELGLPADQRHPNESDQEFHDRQLRQDWRDRNDSAPSAAVREDQGRAAEWDVDRTSEYGNEYYDQDALRSWEQYDQSFEGLDRQEGEKYTDWQDRQARDSYRERNKQSLESDEEQQAAEEAKAEAENKPDTIEGMKTPVEPVEFAEGRSHVETTLKEGQEDSVLALMHHHGLDERTVAEQTGLTALEKHGDVKIRTTIEKDGSTVVAVSYITGTSPDGETWKGSQRREFNPDQGWVNNGYFAVSDNAPKGVGLDVFASEVTALRDDGRYDHISVHAAGDYDSRDEFNGYYTWPRFGFDGEFRFSEGSGIGTAIRKQPKEWQRDQGFIDENDNWRGASGDLKMSDLMSTQTGRDLWFRYGDEGNYHFDLDHNSTSSHILDEYLKERGKEPTPGPRPLPPGVTRAARFRAARSMETLPLSEVDDPLIDKVWDSPEIQALVRAKRMARTAANKARERGEKPAEPPPEEAGLRWWEREVAYREDQARDHGKFADEGKGTTDGGKDGESGPGAVGAVSEHKFGKIDADVEKEGAAALKAHGLTVKDAVNLSGLNALKDDEQTAVTLTVRGDNEAGDGPVTTDARVTGTNEDGKHWEASLAQQVHDDHVETVNFEVSKHAPEDTALKVFAAQVDEAQKQGFGRIEQSVGDQGHGYYSWARQGYDAVIHPSGKLKDAIEKQPKAWREKHGLDGKNISLADLMASKEGRDIWKEHGGAFRGYFDLRSDSPSMKILADYMQKRDVQPAEKAALAERLVAAAKSDDMDDAPPLTPEDEATLDDIWESDEVQELLARTREERLASMAESEQAAARWWERWVAWTAETFDESQVTRGEGGKFGGGGGAPEKVSERQVKADQGWAAAQEKKPPASEHPTEQQKELFPSGLNPTQESVVLTAAQEKIGWSNPDTLKQWEEYDRAVGDANEKVGLPNDYGQTPLTQHPNETGAEFHDRELRAEWRDRNEQRPADAEKMGEPMDWPTTVSDYGTVHNDEDKLAAWQSYDESFDGKGRAEGESVKDYDERYTRDAMRVSNEEADQADAKAAEEERQQAEQERQRNTPEVTEAVESVLKTQEALDYNHTPSSSERIHAKEDIQQSVGAGIAADANVSVDSLRDFNKDLLFQTSEHGDGATDAAKTEKEVESQMAADRIVGKWAVTSGDSDAGAVAVQLVAQETFGLKDAATDHFFGGRPTSEWGAAKEAADKYQPLIGAALQKMHADSQEALKDAPDEIWLFRGVGHSHEEGEVVTLQPLSSFSTRPGTARESFSSGATGSTFAMKVPKSAVVGTGRTGMGCLGEYEVVVMGGSYPIHIVDRGDPTLLGTRVTDRLEAGTEED